LFLAYGFLRLLFVGLPAVVLGITFLPGLMRTVGETIGTGQRTLPEWSTSNHQERAQLQISAHAAPPAPSKSLTYANTA
jgi:Sec-independent protein translocase protein TatA